MMKIPSWHLETHRAWIEGAKIEICDIQGNWFDCPDPSWLAFASYRIKDAKTMTNTAPEFLRRAATIMEERGKQYDKPGGERSMGKTVAAFNAITGRDLSEAEGWLLLQVLKDVRQWQNPGYHADSAEDCIAYAALKAEALAGGSHV